MHGCRQVAREEEAERVVVHTYLFRSAWIMRNSGCRTGHTFLE
jgi:hypothetical protein